MKEVLLIVFFFIHLSFCAQNKKAALDKKPLTKFELQQAISMYEDMTHTKTYIALKQNDKVLFKKLGNVSLIPKEIAEWYHNKSLIEKWVLQNIKDTKFTSVDEGIKLISQSIDLYEKRRLENEELYALMKRANKEEFKKIFAPEAKNLPSMY